MNTALAYKQSAPAGNSLHLRRLIVPDNHVSNITSVWRMVDYNKILPHPFVLMCIRDFLNRKVQIEETCLEAMKAGMFHMRTPNLL